MPPSRCRRACTCRGELTPVAPESVQLLADVTAHTNLGEPVFTRSIHAATLDLIRDAHDFLVLDYFLFNEQGGPAGKLRYEAGIRPVARELREALLALRRAQPDLPILLLVDPINGYYRGTQPVEMSELTQAGIDIVVVDLDPLRDSNPLYSAPWRLFARWWLKPGVSGAWFNPLDADGPPLTLGSLSRLPNFKADHRKVAADRRRRRFAAWASSVPAIRTTPAARIRTSRCAWVAKRCDPCWRANWISRASPAGGALP